MLFEEVEEVLGMNLIGVWIFLRERFLGNIYGKFIDSGRRER